MEVNYKPTFIKDFNCIKNKKAKRDIYKVCFEDILTMKSVSEIKNLKKIKGYDNYYRIRKGDYRIGLMYENNQILFMRVLRRDIIYRYFP